MKAKSTRKESSKTVITASAVEDVAEENSSCDVASAVERALKNLEKLSSSIHENETPNSSSSSGGRKGFLALSESLFASGRLSTGSVLKSIEDKKRLHGATSNIRCKKNTYKM